MFPFSRTFLQKALLLAARKNTCGSADCQSAIGNQKPVFLRATAGRKKTGFPIRLSLFSRPFVSFRILSRYQRRTNGRKADSNWLTERGGSLPPTLTPLSYTAIFATLTGCAPGVVGTP